MRSYFVSILIWLALSGGVGATELVKEVDQEYDKWFYRVLSGEGTTKLVAQTPILLDSTKLSYYLALPISDRLGHKMLQPNTFDLVCIIEKDSAECHFRISSASESNTCRADIPHHVSLSTATWKEDRIYAECEYDKKGSHLTFPATQERIAAFSDSNSVRANILISYPAGWSQSRVVLLSGSVSAITQVTGSFQNAKRNIRSKTSDSEVVSGTNQSRIDARDVNWAAFALLPD